MKLAFITVAALASAAPALGAEVRVVGGGGVQQVLQKLAPRFEAATGDKAALQFAVVGAILQRLKAGAQADVVLLPVPLLDDLEKSGAFHARSRAVVGRIAIGVAVREGAGGPDVSTVDAVRAMLINARSVVFPDPALTPSGAHLVRLLAQMGIADAVRPKLTLRNAIDGGTTLVRDGQAEIGLFLVTEILPVKGVKLAGTLPPAIQGYVGYGVAVAADAPASASEFVKMLMDPGVRKDWTAAGFEPAGGRD
jgi:molybdate transport system substrate-binding protein